jgi:hypothetical protein
MNRIEIHGQRFDIPASWDELSTEQALRLYCALSTYPSLRTQYQGISAADAAFIMKKEMLRILLDEDPQFQKWETATIAAYGEDLGPLIWQEQLKILANEAAENLVEENEQGLVSPALRMTRSPYPVLAGKRTPQLYAPAPGLKNCTLQEMALVFTLLENYATAPREEAADLADTLLASIYRPAKKGTVENKERAYDGDIRQPYVEASVAQRKPLFRSLPPAVRGLLIFWLASCREAIIAQFPNLFKKPSARADGQFERVGNDYGWAAVIMSLAGNLVDTDTVAGKNWGDALVYMSFLEDQRKIQEMQSAAAVAAAKTKASRR